MLMLWAGVRVHGRHYYDPVTVSILAIAAIASLVLSQWMWRRKVRIALRQYAERVRQPQAPWTPPPELSGPVPRRVRMESGTWVRIVVMELATLAVVAFLYWRWIGELPGAWQAPVAAILAAGSSVAMYGFLTRHKHLLCWGVPAPGAIVDVECLDESGTGVYIVRLSFTDLDGNLHMESERSDGDSTPLKGDSIVVLYDPRNPHRHRIYPVSGFEVG